MLKCYLENSADTGHFVTATIESLLGVRDTFTLITFKTFN